MAPAAHTLAAGGERLASLADGDRKIVVVVLLASLVALVFAAVFAKEVLAADQGPEKMREVSKAVQDGAAAYLSRQFRTLAVFAVLVFLLLFLLPAHDANIRIGRSVFFLVGAVFSALVGCWAAADKSPKATAKPSVRPNSARGRSILMAVSRGGSSVRW